VLQGLWGGAEVWGLSRPAAIYAHGVWGFQMGIQKHILVKRDRPDNWARIPRITKEHNER
jgi:hypothetical protein